MAERELDELQRLISAPALAEVSDLKRHIAELRQHIAELERRIEEKDVKAADVSEVLVPAAKQRRAVTPRADLEFAEALRPEVELAIHRSSRVDSAVMSEALYPVLGPALRKMVAGMFSGAESGPFSVDRIILMDRQSALPIAQYTADGLDPDAVDLISGMLDAIKAYVEDAFNATEVDGLNDLRVGEVTVLVEWGPDAVLAAVTRGIVPDDFRPRLAELLEVLHRDHAEVLGDFDGDERTEINLRSAMAQLRGAEASGSGRPLALLLAATLLAMVVVLMIVVTIVTIIGWFQ